MDRVLQPSQVDLSVLESLEWDIIILDKKIDIEKSNIYFSKILANCILKSNSDIYHILKNKYLLSIITIVYNGEKYLQQTIDNVYNQTYKNIEIIIFLNCKSIFTIPKIFIST